MNAYILLIREDLSRYPIPDKDLQYLIKAHREWAKKLSAQGIFKAGYGVGPEGVLMEMKDRSLQTSPLRDLKEGIGGFYIIEAENMNAAIKIAEECPTYDKGDKIEVRPLM